MKSSPNLPGQFLRRLIRKPKDVALSPYLADPKRLNNVIAAIQTMGVYKYYKLDFAEWADRISGDSEQADYWQTVFEDHPEFFRLDSQRQKASLVWRRQHPKNYHVDSGVAVTQEEYDLLMPHEKRRVSRRVLTPEDITSLVDVAIHLHARALEERKESRWWIPVLIGVGTALAGLVGAIVGGFLSGSS